MKYVICYLFLGCPKRHITISSPPPPRGFCKGLHKKCNYLPSAGGGVLGGGTGHKWSHQANVSEYYCELSTTTCLDSTCRAKIIKARSTNSNNCTWRMVAGSYRFCEF